LTTGYIAIALTILSALGTYFLLYTALTNRIAVLETKIDPLWQIVRDKMTNALKSSDHVRKDILLDQLRLGKISVDGAWELRNILQHEMDDQHKDHHKDITSYILVIALIDQEIAKAKKYK